MKIPTAPLGKTGAAADQNKSGSAEGRGSGEAGTADGKEGKHGAAQLSGEKRTGARRNTMSAKPIGPVGTKALYASSSPMSVRGMTTKSVLARKLNMTRSRCILLEPQSLPRHYL